MLFGVIFIFNDFRAKHSEIQSKVLWRENELIQFFEVCIYVVVSIFPQCWTIFFQFRIIVCTYIAEVILAQNAIILYGARYRCRIQKLCYEI